MKTRIKITQKMKLERQERWGKEKEGRERERGKESGGGRTKEIKKGQEK